MAKKKVAQQIVWEGILTKGLYFGTIDPTTTPFGLVSGQTRLDSIQDCAGWFNIRGEKIGSGDISINDLKNIGSYSMEVKELFLVLSEYDATWNIPAGVDHTNPGLDYVLQNCGWIAGVGGFCKVRNSIKQSKQLAEYMELPRKEFFTNIGYDEKTKTFKIDTTPIKENKPIDTDMDVMDQIINNAINNINNNLAIHITGSAPQAQPTSPGSPFIPTIAPTIPTTRPVKIKTGAKKPKAITP